MDNSTVSPFEVDLIKAASTAAVSTTSSINSIHSESTSNTSINDIPDEILREILAFLPMAEQAKSLRLVDRHFQQLINGLHQNKCQITVRLLSEYVMHGFEAKLLATYISNIQRHCASELQHFGIAGGDGTTNENKNNGALGFRQVHWITLNPTNSPVYETPKEVPRIPTAGHVLLPAGAFNRLTVNYMREEDGKMAYVWSFLRQCSRPTTTTIQLFFTRLNSYFFHPVTALLGCFFDSFFAVSANPIEPLGHIKALESLKHLSIFCLIESTTFSVRSPKTDDQLQKKIQQCTFPVVEELLIGGLSSSTVKYLLSCSFPALRRLVLITRQACTVESIAEHLSMMSPETRQQMTHLAVHSLRSVHSARPMTVLSSSSNDPLVAYLTELFPNVVSLKMSGSIGV